jgi:hypothetical protein
MRSTNVASAQLSVLANRKIEHVPITKLKLRENNPRTHSPRQIKQIARSIEQFGFVNPILVDRNKQIVCWHGRVAGAQLLGLKAVPTITLEHLSEENLRAYVIADNRLAEKAGWDKELLAIELQGLKDLEFDFDSIGFDGAEIEVILDSAETATSTPIEDNLPDVDPKRVITQQGDLWTLGKHRLCCSDARRPDAFATLMSGERARLIFVDPPYIGGSGTTLIACEQTHRCARLIEIDPIYCDQTIRRWQNLTGQKARHKITGAPFDRAEPVKRGRHK